ncbi:MAG: glycosyl transferase family 9 [Lysobacterales bacterium 14-68-21]|jgi:ADP-heptose:LPS heptosyltransferase|nr:MAG: glycosyl transferase family 9 [Xanthomonadales bacterium 15-68-25]OZB66473.1 MAG: glycosyl transferase family 9 [Xanthomonadales bacterium 14-68-21]
MVPVVSPDNSLVPPRSTSGVETVAAGGRVPVGGLSARGVHRILVLRPNHRLGNTLLVTPLLCELERQFPGAEVDVVTGCEAATDIFAGFRQVRRIYQVTRRPGHHPWRLWRMIRAMRRARYDLAIDCAKGSRSARMLIRWSGARQWVAPPFDDNDERDAGPAWQAVWAQAPGHFALDAVHALRHALSGGRAVQEWPMPRLRIKLREDELQEARDTLDDLLVDSGGIDHGGRVIAIFPNATGNKRLPSEWWQRFIESLQQRDPSLRFIEMVAAHGRSQLEGRLPAYFSSDVRRMAALVRQCDAYISGDCGVMHLACASGTPTLGLFTRPNLERYRPYGPHDGAVAVDPSDVTPAVAAATAFLAALPEALAAA